MDTTEPSTLIHCLDMLVLEKVLRMETRTFLQCVYSLVSEDVVLWWHWWARVSYIEWNACDPANEAIGKKVDFLIVQALFQ